MTTSSLILLVEDDLTLASSLKIAISDPALGKLKVKLASSLETAYQELELRSFELAVIDRVLPDGDGLEIVEYLADVAPATKVLVLTQKREVAERIEGLAGGADDYLAKPVDVRELKLRVKRLTTSYKLVAAQYLQVGDVCLYPDQGKLVSGEVSAQLRRRESQILGCLLSHHDRVISRPDLIDRVWRGDELPSNTTLDVYVRRLRIHLGSHSGQLETVRGYGYRFNSLREDKTRR